MLEIYLLTTDGLTIKETRTRPFNAVLRFVGDNVRVYCENSSNRRVASHRWNYAALIALQASGIKHAKLRDVQKRERSDKPVSDNDPRKYMNTLL